MRGGRNAAGLAPVRRHASPVSMVVADWRRIQGTWLLPLTVLGPLGVSIMGVVAFLLRADLLNLYRRGLQTGWGVMISRLGPVEVLALGLGATLIASMIVDLEHRSGTWRQLFALPVSRSLTYVVKFGWAAALLAFSATLMSVSYAALMTWQHLGSIPWPDVLGTGALLWVAVLPLLALQLLLSTVLRNQALPLTVGILLPLLGTGMSQMPAWLPWRLLTEALAAPGGPKDRLVWLPPAQIMAIGVAWVVPLVVFGALYLARREVQ